MARKQNKNKYEKGDIREYLGQRLGQLETERTDHEPLWREIKEFILPRAGRFDDLHGTVERIPTYDSILNSTATNAVKVWVAFIMAGMSSPARPWFRLTSDQVGRQTTSEESAWLDAYRDIMLDVFARSNFYHMLPRVYEEGGAFGNGCMYIDGDDEDIVRFYHYTMGEFYWGLSSRLEIDTIYRPFVMKVSQVVGRWGVDNVSTTVREEYNNGNLNTDVNVVHAIEPNVDSLPKKLRPVDRTKRFVSIYYEQSSKEKQDEVLSVSGYREFPAMPFRINPASDDAYGIGVGADCLGDVRELQHKEMELATMLDYINEPMLQSTGGIGQVFRHPGAVNHVNPHSQDELKAVYKVQYPTGGLIREIETLESRIREWFDNHLAQNILNEDRSNVTAAEINAAEQEKLLLAGPVLESVQIFLAKVIKRVFEIMIDLGVGPPPPESLETSPLSIEFLGVLAQAQKAVGVRSMERSLDFVARQIDVSQSLDPLDNLDMDEQYRDYVKMIGLPSDQLLDPDKVEDKRALRNQQAQQALQMEQNAAMADTAQTMANTPTQGDTALRSALDVVGAGF